MRISIVLDYNEDHRDAKTIWTCEDVIVSDISNIIDLITNGKLSDHVRIEITED